MAGIAAVGRWAVLGVLIAALPLSACSSPRCEILLDNAGKTTVAVTSLRWGQREAVDDPASPIRLPAVPVKRVRIPTFGETLEGEVPKEVSVTWVPEGLPGVSRTFELRRRVDPPHSDRTAAILEFDENVLRVYQGPADYTDPTPRRMLLEIR